MPTYIYETVPETPGAPVKRFEVRQSMMDNPLRTHPETGELVRRVITGGAGVITSGKAPAPAPARSSGGCGPSCGCH